MESATSIERSLDSNDAQIGRDGGTSADHNKCGARGRVLGAPDRVLCGFLLHDPVVHGVGDKRRIKTAPQGAATPTGARANISHVHYSTERKM